MLEVHDLKIAVYQKCCEIIAENITKLEEIDRVLGESRNNEAKSSAGDKYETGRSMVQLEEEKIRRQIRDARESQSLLSHIQLDKKNSKADVGSLVITNKGKYFIAVGFGKIQMEKETIYGISIDSPIGKELLNKTKGNTFIFNKQKFEILEVL
jgi:transcription elongation GreA/GreB family factor